MYERSRMKSEKRAVWLMALGRALRAEYDERMGPPSPRLAALFEQAEIAVQPKHPERQVPRLTWPP
jgi:hypothetical protein